MANWLKIEKATSQKPEVLRLAEKLDIHPAHSFGLCVIFWCWCDDQLSNSNAVGVSEKMIDALVGRSGFAAGLIEVGWLHVDNGSLVIPNFDRHMSESAKKRALTAKRVAKLSAVKTNAASVSTALADKRRLDTNTTHIPAKGISEHEQGFMSAPNEDFLRFWQIYPRKIGREPAWKEWYLAVAQIESEKALNSVTAVEWLIGVARAFAASKLGSTGGNFVPSPAKFLSEQRFFDDVSQWENDNGKNRSGSRKATGKADRRTSNGDAEKAAADQELDDFVANAPVIRSGRS